MLNFLASLKPAQIHAAVKVMAESRFGICNVSKLSEDPIEANRMANRLADCQLVRVNEDLGEPMVVMSKPFKEFATHVKSFAEQLDFSLGAAKPAGPEPSKAKPSKRTDMLEVIAEYARLKGIQDGNMPPGFVRQNCKSAVALLTAAKSVEKAKEIIRKVKNKLEKRALDWSLNGAVMNHMHGFMEAAETGSKKGGWDW